MNKQTELINVGVDYLRMTTDDEETRASMFDASRIIGLDDAVRGYEPRPGGMIGFYGRKGRHWFFGERQEWAMLQVTGYQCREHLNMLLRQRARATRIDIQVTLRVPGGIDGVMKSALFGSINAKPADGRKWKTKNINEDGRIQTIYIGKRASEWFGRIYDKYEESHEEQYRDCVRFEIEIKGQAARDVYDKLKESTQPRAFMNTLVVQWYKAHGVAVDSPDVPTVSYEKPQKPIHRDDSSLAWLARMVSGTVARLCATGHWFPAFDALFSKALTNEDRAGILYSTALVWGS